MCQGERTLSSSLFECLSFLDDPRDNRGKKHDLREVLVLIIIGFLLGKKDFVNIEHCLNLEIDNLKKVLELKNGIPSHDTMSRVMRIIDDDDLIGAVVDWLWQIIDHHDNHFAIDGKGIIAAAVKNKKGKTPYILNVIDCATKLVIMQMKVGEKTNEIPELSHILDCLPLKDAVVTTDAIGTQKEVINKINSKDGYFVLPVKENQKRLYKDILDYFHSLLNKNEISKYVEEVDFSHGRIEKRTYYVSHTTDCILDEDFSLIKTICIVRRERQAKIYNESNDLIDNKTVEEVPYISNLVLEPQKIGKYIREHWAIENNLHWVLDNTFSEDRSTNKKENSVQNTSLLRKIAYNILKIRRYDTGNQAFEYIIDELSHNMSHIWHYVFDTEL